MIPIEAPSLAGILAEIETIEREMRPRTINHAFCPPDTVGYWMPDGAHDRLVELRLRLDRAVLLDPGQQ